MSWLNRFFGWFTRDLEAKADVAIGSILTPELPETTGDGYLSPAVIEEAEAHNKAVDEARITKRAQHRTKPKPKPKSKAKKPALKTKPSKAKAKRSKRS